MSATLHMISGQSECLNISLNPAQVNVKCDDVSINEPSDRLLNQKIISHGHDLEVHMAAVSATSCLELQCSYGSLNKL